ncbi:YjbH domain-containing protein [Agarivorans sp. TSD2052]|uniref:YjbH domain-containing protein n=1 Tax=Agarivorans sp. TSD2052 TaxID=2937286 RepID=UPI00200F4228|nr:YjbH domain-containing protein [Agarivorans sp. TSD2052]UPW20087.1 YjbH domain-containing protein [Agarivorans sp. TSD2052]
MSKRQFQALNIKPLAPLAMAISALLPLSASLAAPSQSDFGGVGLIQIPTARMSPEGEFAFNLNYVDPYIRGAIAITPVPWFEGVIRYTSVENRLYSPYPGYSGDQSYKDKGFDAKFRLWQESYYVPEIALGFRDIGGTGLFASEYLVASKRWGNLDFTLGMGWGYLANGSDLDNPLCKISDSACERPGRKPGDNGGKLGAGDFFRGPNAGLLAGLEYHTPIEGLSLKLEYDSNDYQHEALDNQFDQSLPVNIGAVYAWGDYVNLNLGYERGNTLMAGITIRTNFQTVPNQIKLDEPPEALNDTETSAQVDYDDLVDTLADNAGLQASTLVLSENRISVSGEQLKYRKRSDADQRIARVLHNRLPDTVSEFEIVETAQGLPLYSSTIDRAAFLDNAQNQLEPEQESPYVSSQVYQESDSTAANQTSTQVDKTPYNVSLYPGLTQSIGSAETFYFYAVSLHLAGEYQFTDKLKADGIASWTIANNYDKFNYTVDDSTGAIPRSRTYIREYLTASDIGLSNLQLTYFDNYGKNFYAQYYGGYLEFMYGGVGGELLYRPYNSSLAFGVDLNRVKQRDFDRGFGFRDYEVTTGHAALYWQSPWYGVNTELSAGQYLSGDRGFTVDVSREFDNGTIAGFFFTKTDVSAEDYGEGSFNKGFYIKIPFDMMLTRSSTKYAAFNWTPLTRDGGQKLIRKYSLYDETKAKGRKSIGTH